ncbi:ATPase subunit D [Zalerion maritima]|uniref:V-type proton ATPase subunit n=1 Tax=Zalerion maritima TaxID=339359 RepID=A0AAD5RX63_9PEZI|nr:ATPase subunit D [Zalerion maritima]
MLYHNASHGFIDGVVRGYLNQLLTSANYQNLTQCQSIDDMKLQLGPTYGDFLSSLPPGPTTSALQERITEKFIQNFMYLKANSNGTLRKFLEYITYGYMIDNIALLITGTLHDRDIKELMDRTHPLGKFEAMPVLSIATNVEELYNSVLIETPLAPYFKGSLSHQDLDTLNIEIVKETLYKNYLEDFYQWINSNSETAGTASAEDVSGFLQFEADRRAINITLNSFDTELTKPQRTKLYASIGKLYPDGTTLLSRADDVDGVVLACQGVPAYQAALESAGMGGGPLGGLGNQAGGMGGGIRNLDELLYQREMEISKLAFTQEFSLAIFYAWVKLQEQEVRNVVWIAECISQNQRERINNFISVLE